MTTTQLQQLQKTERLTDAFRIFNELSENLANSYQGLEEQIAKLNQELAAARSERVSTFIEKEKLASRLQQILAALPAAVIIVNPFGLVIDCNNHALEFLGDPLLGQDWQKVMNRSLLAVTGSPRERQLKDGRRVNISRNLLSNDAEQIILLSDISELRSLQETLAQQQHLSAMGEMVASLAHQVRTPLATAVLYASQLSKPGLKTDKQAQFSQKILERLHFLERQVDDMLIFAKQGRLTMHNFSLGQLLAQVSDSMLSYAGQFTLLNNISKDNFLGNQDALLGALLNILNNAIEASANQITLCADHISNNSVCIAITDNGLGMDTQQQIRLFEPFYTTKTQGTGLGLAVVDSVVRAHHGKIHCQSQLGLGSCFSLILPIINSQTKPIASHCLMEEHNHEAI